jgi:hypothetical protein
MPEMTCRRKSSSHPVCQAAMSVCQNIQIVYNLLLNQQFLAIHLEQAVVNHGLSSAGAELTGVPKRVERQSSAIVENSFVLIEL